MAKPRVIPPRIIPAVTWEQMVAYGTSAGFAVGPASATDNAIVRFDGTTGKLIQNSLVTVSDTGQVAIAAGAADDAFMVTSTFNGFQAKIRYDASNRFEIGVTAVGTTVLRSVGSVPTLTIQAGSSSTGGLVFSGATVLFSASRFTATGTSTADCFRITSSGARQFRVAYDASNYTTITVSSAGAVTFDAVGASAGFAFSAVVNTTESYQVDGTKVVGNQGAAVADATDATTVITQLNTLLARLRDHGLIAT